MAYVTKACNGDSWGKHYQLKLECVESNVSSSANTSNVSVSLYIKSDHSDFSYKGYNTYFTATIDGAGQSQISKTMTVNSSDWYLIGTCPVKTITHNTDGSRSVYVKAVMNTAYSRIYETTIDATFTLTTIPRYFTETPTLTYTSATETTMNFSWGTSETCTKVILYYKLSSASSYSTKTIYDNSTGTTSGTGGLTGLTAGGTYNIYAKCTRKDSGLASDSATLTQTSIAYPSISKIGTAAITIPAPGSSVNQVLTLNNPLSRSVTVYAKNANSSGTLIKSGTTSGTSSTLALAANDMYTAIGAANTSGTIAYYCVYNDGTNNHTSAMANGTYATSAANCGPTVSANPTYTNTNSTHTSLVGSDTIIQGQSSFKITSPAVTARGGASIAKYYFKIGNGSYESATTATKTYSSTSLSGTVSISVYAEDTRGYTSTAKTAYMRVLAYSAPNANISVTRNGYTTDATITVISATRSVLSKSSATSTDVNNWRGNTSSNKISLAISPTGPELAAYVIGGTAATVSNASVSITKASLTSAYTITVNISDRIITKTLTFTLNKATPIMSILNTNRVGINKMDPSCELDVNGTIKSSGDILTSTNVKVSGIPLVSFANINSNNKNNYPWHRIATVVVGTGQYQDKDCILDIRHKYNGGGYGRIKISVRTNSTGTACSASANWLYRYNMSGVSIGVGVWGVTGDNVYVDVYYKTPGAYARATVRQIDESKLYTLVASSEAADTTTSYKKTSVECYKTIETAATELRSQNYSFITYSTINDLLQCYPVGSIYISVNNTNPSTYFGGTWVAFGTGRTLVGVDTSQTEFNTVEKTSGAKSNSYTPAGTVQGHKLTIEEMPKHSHTDGTDPDSGINASSGHTSAIVYYNADYGRSTSEVGGDGAHSHGWTGTAANISTLQPYITVYMWKRTA